MSSQGSRRFNTELAPEIIVEIDFILVKGREKLAAVPREFQHHPGGEISTGTVRQIQDCASCGGDHLLAIGLGFHYFHAVHRHAGIKPANDDCQHVGCKMSYIVWKA